MSATTMPTRRPLGIAGVAALLGVVLISIDNGFLGNPPRDDALGMLEFVDDGLWLLSRLIGLFGVLLWGVAFTLLGRSSTSAAAGPWAKNAGLVLTVAISVFTVQYAIDGFGLGTLAREWSDGEITSDVAEVQSQLANYFIGGLSMLAQCLLGLGLLLYAITFLVSGEYPRWSCWLGIVSCAGWFVAGALVFLRIGVEFEAILPFAGLGAAWVVVLAIIVLRRGRQASPGEPGAAATV